MQLIQKGRCVVCFSLLLLATKPLDIVLGNSYVKGFLVFVSEGPQSLGAYRLTKKILELGKKVG